MIMLLRKRGASSPADRKKVHPEYSKVHAHRQPINLSRPLSEQRHISSLSDVTGCLSARTTIQFCNEPVTQGRESTITVAEGGVHGDLVLLMWHFTSHR